MSLPAWLKLIKGEIETGDGEVVLMLHEPVGFNRNTGEGMSSRVFGMALASIPKQKHVALEINTMGGSVPEGIAMMNQISARGNVTTRVVGYAASMGALILQGGAKREMMPGTMVIIHNPMASIDQGDQREAKRVSDMLKQVKSSLVGVLVARTGQDEKTISKMMDDTTGMTPDEALKLGFIDNVCEGAPALNSFDLVNFFNSCRELHSAAPRSGEETARQNKNKMKNITSSLAKLKLVDSAEITDEAVVVTQLEASFGKFAAVVTERDTLKNQVTIFETQLKDRVTNKVTKAVTDKIVKAERKDSLIAAGIQNEASLDFIDDLYEAARTTTTATRRGAAPVPASDDNATELDTIRNQMRTASPEDVAVLATKARELRGHKELFGAPATK